MQTASLGLSTAAAAIDASAISSVGPAAHVEHVEPVEPVASSRTATVDDLASRLQAWKARGAQGFDPIGFLCIEAMVRRATSCNGPARAVVEGRARRRLDALVGRFEQAPMLPAPPSTALQAPQSDASRPSDAAPLRAPAADARNAGSATGQSSSLPYRGALAELLAHIASQEEADGPVVARRDGETPPARELKTLRYFQGTWAKLGADRRLKQSLSTLPENAGPLNSQRLVHVALTAMRDLSPAYFEHFIEHVDTLLWLDEAGGGLPLAGKAVLHADGDKVVKPERKRTRR
ncbi:MAG: hypothetical protein JWQ11_1521 [Rhizobacter sp.]|nr:hypothetical protein [Rhizobacter sp.]